MMNEIKHCIFSSSLQFIIIYIYSTLFQIIIIKYIMSCVNGNCYLPKPPRAWSRVQNSCSLNEDPNVVYSNANIQMLNKGNVLQYKANSSNLTKSQKYSKIAKGQWVNRNTTWATQSTRGYTNPNTTSLKRYGNINVAIDPITGAIIGSTNSNPTCEQPVIPVNENLPQNEPGSGDIVIPPPIIPTPESNVFPPTIEDKPLEPLVIQDGGSLICSVQENICTGETNKSLSQQLCHPTTDSDVPGQIQELCWNDGLATWYPRQRYIMTNSANKWPVNATLLGATIINPPSILSVTSSQNIVTLVWISNNRCLLASNFNVYQNNILYEVLSGDKLTTNIVVETNKTYEYYIIAENITAKVKSVASDVVSLFVP